MKKYREKHIKKNVGSYVLIERIDTSHNYGEHILCGNAKYISQKSNIDFAQPRVLYFEKDIVGQVKLDEHVYDAVYYYNVIINFQTIHEEYHEFEVGESPFDGIPIL